ncbi:hypothetical protein MMC12_001102 [Toensbergia leucococca]|nr:hypothetical protein [Toensbergia leucococca]
MHQPLTLILLILASYLFALTSTLCVGGTCTTGQTPQHCVIAFKFPIGKIRRLNHLTYSRTNVRRGNGVCYYPSATARLVENLATGIFFLPTGTYSVHWVGLLNNEVGIFKDSVYILRKTWIDLPSLTDLGRGAAYIEVYGALGADPLNYIWQDGETFVANGYTGLFFILRQFGFDKLGQPVEVWMKAT